MIRFEIEIRNDKRRTYRIFNWFALVISFAGFAMSWMYDQWMPEASLAACLLIGYLIVRIFRLRQGRSGYLFDDDGYFFLVLAIGWAILYKFFLAFVCVLLGLMYKLAMQKISFLFQKDKIIKTNFPKKDILWKDVDNVVFKDGILTIDFKNNHIIQGEVISPEKINGQEFNSFVRFLIINAQL